MLIKSLVRNTGNYSERPTKTLRGEREREEDKKRNLLKYPHHQHPQRRKAEEREAEVRGEVEEVEEGEEVEANIGDPPHVTPHLPPQTHPRREGAN